MTTGEIPSHSETTAARDQRMHWWREARLGMFIHWSPSTSLNAYWQGRPTDFCSEWIRHTARIPCEDYHAVCRNFNPRRFDAEEWVMLARQTGMKYVVFTAKHHDGFCWWNTGQTNFNIMKTACGRDLMRELADACHRHAMPLGWYYSPRDWDHPDYLPHYRRLPDKGRNYGGWWGYSVEEDCGCPACVRDLPVLEHRDPTKAELARYLEFMRAQLRELMTAYGPAAVLWFDAQEHPPDLGKTADLVRMLRDLDPRLIINDRVATQPGWGDFAVHEWKIPQERQARDWESCLCVNGSWSFNAYDLNWKSATQLVHELCEIVSRGGNLLLNIGPDQDGVVPPECVRRMQELGRWMAVNGEAIYGSQAGDVKALGSLRYTRNATYNYVIALEWPGRQLVLPGVTITDGSEVRLLGVEMALHCQASPEGSRITLPEVLQSARPCDHAWVFRWKA